MTLLRLVRVSLLLAPFLYQPTIAQVLDPTFTSPSGLYASGVVNTFGPAQADGKRLVAGAFTRVNDVAVSNLVRLDANGALDVTFSQNLGTASEGIRIQELANGQYLLWVEARGGRDQPMVTAGGLTRAGLLRLNADGTADATFNAGTGPHSPGGYLFPQKMAVQADGKILLAGTFDSFNGQPANGLVRLNANGTVDASFNVGTGPGTSFYSASPVVNSLLALPDGKTLLAGFFDSFNGQTANYLVRLNANGSVDATFTAAILPSLHPEATGLALQPDGKVLVTGRLPATTGGGDIVRLTTTGALDPSFTPPSFIRSDDNYAYDISNMLLQPDGKILLSGSFLPENTHTIVRLNPNGTEDTGFQVANGPSSEPLTIGLQANGTLLVGGDFNTFNGTEAPLGRLTSTGAPDPAFVPKVQKPGTVATMLRQADGQLLLAGDFTEFSGQHVHRLVRLTAAGALDGAYAAAVGVQDPELKCLALQADSKLLVGGSLSVRRFLPSGAPDPAFATPFPDQEYPPYVAAVAVQPDGKLLVGGTFWVRANGLTYSSLLRLNANGSLDPSFAGAATDNSILAITNNGLLVQPDGRVVAASLGFTSDAGFQGRLVRYEPTGAIDASFNPDFTRTATASNPGSFPIIVALTPQADGKLLVGGYFDAVNGVPRANLARLTATGALDAGFVPPASLTGGLWNLRVLPTGGVLVGGSFTAGAYTNLLRVLPTGALDDTFAPTANPAGPYAYSIVNTVLVQPDGELLVAGAFTAVGGQPALGVARIKPSGVLAVVGPQTGTDGLRAAVWPVPARSLLHVQPDARARALRLELLDGLGRVVRAQPVVPGTEQVLDVAGLPAGIYLLRVHYAAGTVSQRVAVE
jgi:uncharacterized delta-60 repeat protein